MQLTRSVASGYLYPKTDSPLYTQGNAICTALSAWGLLLTFAYQVLCARTNRNRDLKEGKPAGDHRPDTQAHADDAYGFRYQL